MVNQSISTMEREEPEEGEKVYFIEWHEASELKRLYDSKPAIEFCLRESCTKSGEVDPWALGEAQKNLWTWGWLSAGAINKGLVEWPYGQKINQRLWDARFAA
jgi:hypothetical protein